MHRTPGEVSGTVKSEDKETPKEHVSKKASRRSSRVSFAPVFEYVKEYQTNEAEWKTPSPVHDPTTPQQPNGGGPTGAAANGSEGTPPAPVADPDTLFQNAANTPTQHQPSYGGFSDVSELGLDPSRSSAGRSTLGSLSLSASTTTTPTRRSAVSSSSSDMEAMFANIDQYASLISGGGGGEGTSGLADTTVASDGSDPDLAIMDNTRRVTLAGRQSMLPLGSPFRSRDTDVGGDHSLTGGSIHAALAAAMGGVQPMGGGMTSRGHNNVSLLSTPSERSFTAHSTTNLDLSILNSIVNAGRPSLPASSAVQTAAAMVGSGTPSLSGTVTVTGGMPRHHQALFMSPDTPGGGGGGRFSLPSMGMPAADLSELIKATQQQQHPPPEVDDEEADLPPVPPGLSRRVSSSSNNVSVSSDMSVDDDEGTRTITAQLPQPPSTPRGVADTSIASNPDLYQSPESPTPPSDFVISDDVLDQYSRQSGIILIPDQPVPVARPRQSSAAFSTDLGADSSFNLDESIAPTAFHAPAALEVSTDLGATSFMSTRFSAIGAPSSREPILLDQSTHFNTTMDDTAFDPASSFLNSTQQDGLMGQTFGGGGEGPATASEGESDAPTSASVSPAFDASQSVTNTPSGAAEGSAKRAKRRSSTASSSQPTRRSQRLSTKMSISSSTASSLIRRRSATAKLQSSASSLSTSLTLDPVAQQPSTPSHHHHKQQTCPACEQSTPAKSPRKSRASSAHADGCKNAQQPRTPQRTPLTPTRTGLRSQTRAQQAGGMSTPIKQEEADTDDADTSSRMSIDRVQTPKSEEKRQRRKRKTSSEFIELASPSTSTSTATNQHGTRSATKRQAVGKQPSAITHSPDLLLATTAESQESTDLGSPTVTGEKTIVFEKSYLMEETQNVGKILSHADSEGESEEEGSNNDKTVVFDRGGVMMEETQNVGQILSARGAITTTTDDQNQEEEEEGESEPTVCNSNNKTTIFEKSCMMEETQNVGKILGDESEDESSIGGFNNDKTTVFEKSCFMEETQNVGQILGTREQAVDSDEDISEVVSNNDKTTVFEKSCMMEETQNVGQILKGSEEDDESEGHERQSMGGGGFFNKTIVFDKSGIGMEETQNVGQILSARGAPLSPPEPEQPSLRLDDRTTVFEKSCLMEETQNVGLILGGGEGGGVRMELSEREEEEEVVGDAKDPTVEVSLAMEEAVAPPPPPPRSVTTEFQRPFAADLDRNKFLNASILSLSSAGGLDFTEMDFTTHHNTQQQQEQQGEREEEEPASQDLFPAQPQQQPTKSVNRKSVGGGMLDRTVVDEEDQGDMDLTRASFGGIHHHGAEEEEGEEEQSQSQQQQQQDAPSLPPSQHEDEESLLRSMERAVQMAPSVAGTTTAARSPISGHEIDDHDTMDMTRSHTVNIRTRIHNILAQQQLLRTPGAATSTAATRRTTLAFEPAFQEDATQNFLMGTTAMMAIAPKTPAQNKAMSALGYDLLPSTSSTSDPPPLASSTFLQQQQSTTTTATTMGRARRQRQSMAASSLLPTASNLNASFAADTPARQQHQQQPILGTTRKRAFSMAPSSYHGGGDDQQQHTTSFKFAALMKEAKQHVGDTKRKRLTIIAGGQDANLNQSFGALDRSVVAMNTTTVAEHEEEEEAQNTLNATALIQQQGEQEQQEGEGSGDNVGIDAEHTTEVVAMAEDGDNEKQQQHDATSSSSSSRMSFAQFASLLNLNFTDGPLNARRSVAATSHLANPDTVERPGRRKEVAEEGVERQRALAVHWSQMQIEEKAAEALVEVVEGKHAAWRECEERQQQNDAMPMVITIFSAVQAQGVSEDTLDQLSDALKSVKSAARRNAKALFAQWNDSTERAILSSLDSSLAAVAQDSDAVTRGAKTAEQAAQTARTALEDAKSKGPALQREREHLQRSEAEIQSLSVRTEVARQQAECDQQAVEKLKIRRAELIKQRDAAKRRQALAPLPAGALRPTALPPLQQQQHKPAAAALSSATAEVIQSQCSERVLTALLPYRARHMTASQITLSFDSVLPSCTPSQSPQSPFPPLVSRAKHSIVLDISITAPSDGGAPPTCRVTPRDESEASSTSLRAKVWECMGMEQRARAVSRLDQLPSFVRGLAVGLKRVGDALEDLCRESTKRGGWASSSSLSDPMTVEFSSAAKRHKFAVSFSLVPRSHHEDEHEEGSARVVEASAVRVWFGDVREEDVLAVVEREAAKSHVGFVARVCSALDQL